MLWVKFCLFQLGKPSVLFLDPPVRLPSRSWWFGCSSYVPLASSFSSSSVCGFQSGLTLQTRPRPDGRARFGAPDSSGESSAVQQLALARRFTCLILNLVSLCGFQPLHSRLTGSRCEWRRQWLCVPQLWLWPVGEVPAPHRSACGISGDRKQMDIYFFFFMVWIVLKGKHMQ